MILKEHEGREIFSKYGIRVPPGFLIRDIDNDENLSAALSSAKKFSEEHPEVRELVLKSQILSGKRGKSGGIVFSGIRDFAKNAIFFRNRKINGETVSEVLAVEKLKIAREFYVGVTIDRFERCPIFIFSTAGGIDIEETVASSPEKVFKILLREKILKENDFLKVLKDEGNSNAAAVINENVRVQLLDAAKKLAELFTKEDCTLAEINPLVLTDGGILYAADAKIIVDDNSLPRHPEWLKIEGRGLGAREKEARDLGLSYVDLDGALAIIGNGAGLVMATLDAVKVSGAQPANFCDIGGGASTAMMQHAMEIILKKKSVKAVFVNIFGGITRCDLIAEGLTEYLEKNKPRIPAIVRMTGTNEEKGRMILQRAGIKSFTSFKESVKAAANAAGAVTVTEVTG